MKTLRRFWLLPALMLIMAMASVFWLTPSLTQPPPSFSTAHDWQQVTTLPASNDIVIAASRVADPGDPTAILTGRISSFFQHNLPLLSLGIVISYGIIFGYRRFDFHKVDRRLWTLALKKMVAAVIGFLGTWAIFKVGWTNQANAV